MLVTTCGHCQARFRVTPQQLNARQGQVRCGRCHSVFNGFQALERFPDDDTGGRLLAEQEARERDVAEQEATEAAESFDASPAVRADAGDMPDLETVEDVQHASVPKAPAPPAAPPYSPTEPDLLLEPPPKEQPSRAWSFGVALLAMVLLAELAFAFRGPVAQRYPALRPSLEAACTWLECSVPYAREDGLLKLEDSELLEVPGKPSEIALGARIRNLASVAQEYPHLELTLTDNSGQPAARRVLRPTDYLGRPLAAGEVIGPGVELALQMRLETPRLKATGYELLLFYP
jgi:predicted Zn finger-like uncharacterized protein